MKNIWDYDTKPLTELLEAIVDNRGKTVPTTETGRILIATNCVTNNTLFPVYEKVRFISDETYETWFRAHPIPGDIIFVNKGTPGKVCMVPDPIEFCIAQDMIALRANDKEIYNKYLFAVLRSESMAFKWKCESVKSGHPVALHNLAVSYFTGSGCDKDWCKAFDAMKKSADGGLLDAIGDVGMMYHYGIGVEQNFDEALKWYRKALELGGAEADFKIWLIEKFHRTLPCSKCR